jgi:hypothetical protein
MAGRVEPLEVKRLDHLACGEPDGGTYLYLPVPIAGTDSRVKSLVRLGGGCQGRPFLSLRRRALYPLSYGRVAALV